MALDNIQLEMFYSTNDFLSKTFFEDAFIFLDEWVKESIQEEFKWEEY
jgi:hypothetical protein